MQGYENDALFIQALKTWSSGPGQRYMALPWIFSLKNEHPTSNVQHPTSNYGTPLAFRFNYKEERSDIHIRCSMLSVRCSVFIQSKSPLGITKAWSSGPGFFTSTAFNRRKTILPELHGLPQCMRWGHGKDCTTHSPVLSDGKNEPT